MPHRRGGGLRGDGRGARRRRRPLPAVPGHHTRGRPPAQPRQETRQRHQLLIGHNVLVLYCFEDIYRVKSM